MNIELVEAPPSAKALLRRLLELYLYDFSEIDEADVDGHGLFSYDRIDLYWIEAVRWPFLIRVDSNWAGFALVRESTFFPDNETPTRTIAEFFVMRKYRRKGVGQCIARDIFARFPGRWEVAELTDNHPAQAFWRTVIDNFTRGNFAEYQLATDRWLGPVQVFEVK